MNNEPVAWMLTLPDGTHDWVLDGNGCEGYIPLYTHPVNVDAIDTSKQYVDKTQNNRHDLGIAEAIGFDKGYAASQAKTLTDEEITDIASTLLIATDAIEYEWGVCVTEFARAILRKAQEK